jgi:tetratricopeptide (TPR) repeat protein
VDLEPAAPRAAGGAALAGALAREHRRGHQQAADELARHVSPDLDAADQSAAYYNLGCACASGGDADAAAKAFETSIAKSPKNVEAINNLAVLLSEKKDRDPARELALYKHAVEVDPTFASAHLSLGSFYQSEPKYQDTALAIHHYEEYAKYEKDDKAKVDEVMRTIASLRRTLPRELSAPKTGIRR